MASTLIPGRALPKPVRPGGVHAVRVLMSSRRGALVYSLRSVPRGRPAVSLKTVLINAAPATGFAAQESGSTPMKERIVNVSGILMRSLTTRESII